MQRTIVRRTIVLVPLLLISLVTAAAAQPAAEASGKVLFKSGGALALALASRQVTAA